MIIFNWGSQNLKEDGKVYPIECANCTNDVFYDLVKVSKRAGVFFIPLFSYGTKFWMLCPICDCGYRLESKAEFESAKNFSEITEAYIWGEISDEDYLNHKHNFESPISIADENDDYVDLGSMYESDEIDSDKHIDVRNRTPDVECKGVQLCTEYDEQAEKMTVAIFDPGSATKVNLIVGGVTKHEFSSPSVDDCAVVDKEKYEKMEVKVKKQGTGVDACSPLLLNLDRDVKLGGAESVSVGGLLKLLFELVDDFLQTLTCSKIVLGRLVYRARPRVLIYVLLNAVQSSSSCLVQPQHRGFASHASYMWQIRAPKISFPMAARWRRRRRRSG